MPEGKSSITPFQPYLLLQAEHYQKIIRPEMGISHFYQFTLSQEEMEINAVPDGSIDLLFNIGPKGVQTYLGGTVFHVKQWQMGEEQTCFGVRFQPGQGTLPRDITMDMLINEDILIDGDLFGENLEERIAQAKNLEERASVFWQAYEQLVAKSKDLDGKKNVEQYVLKRIYDTKGTISMNQIAQETNYSPCYIRRIFKQYQGISPKQFAQFIRFQYLLEVLQERPEQNEMVAQQCGYFDEAHMMKEFKTNTGVTLEQYKRMMGTAQAR